MNDMKELLSLLLYHQHSVRILHWKSFGGTFDNAHKVFDDYKEDMEKQIDEVAEMIMMMDENPVTLVEAFSILKDSSTNVVTTSSSVDYDAKDQEGFKAIKVIFNQILDKLKEITTSENTDIPNDIISELETIQYWYRLQIKYLNKRRLKDD